MFRRPTPPPRPALCAEPGPQHLVGVRGVCDSVFKKKNRCSKVQNVSTFFLNGCGGGSKQETGRPGSRTEKIGFEGKNESW